MMPRFPKQPRIAPLEPPYGPDVAPAVESLGPPIALFRVLARRPDRAAGIHGWGQYYLSRRTALTLRQQELVIHRTTARCGADYEWGVHAAVFAARVGFDERQLTSLATGDAGDTCWTAEDGAVIAAVDALYERHDLDDAEWSALVGAVGEEGAIDLLLVCGWYHAISFAVRALRLPLEPGTAPVGAR